MTYVNKPTANPPIMICNQISLTGLDDETVTAFRNGYGKVTIPEEKGLGF
jgi:hypothetical protein